MKEELSWFKSKLYSSDEECLFDTDELISIALTYPSVLVACADGLFDADERTYLASIARALGEDEGADVFEEIKYLERYSSLIKLAKLKEGDKSRLLDILAGHCAHDAVIGELILNSMYGIAEASEGISEVEQECIKSIKKQLGIGLN